MGAHACRGAASRPAQLIRSITVGDAPTAEKQIMILLLMSHYRS